MTLPIVEELRGLRGDYRLHCTQVAADTIEELVEALERASERLGIIPLRAAEIRSLLAKIGGDA